MKRPEDILQADIVEKLVKDFLPQWHSRMRPGGSVLQGRGV